MDEWKTVPSRPKKCARPPDDGAPRSSPAGGRKHTPKAPAPSAPTPVTAPPPAPAATPSDDGAAGESSGASSSGVAHGGGARARPRADGGRAPRPTRKLAVSEVREGGECGKRDRDASEVGRAGVVRFLGRRPSPPCGRASSRDASQLVGCGRALPHPRPHPPTHQHTHQHRSSPTLPTWTPCSPPPRTRRAATAARGRCCSRARPTGLGRRTAAPGWRWGRPWTSWMWRR